jgi:membrane protease YdiL (CAAX protease family)
MSFAFHPDRQRSPMVLVMMGLTYLLLLVGCVAWLRRRGELRQRLAPRGGDLTIGALIAAVSYMIAAIGHAALSGTFAAEEVWVQRLYLQIGDPTVGAPFVVAFSVLAIAAVEEIVWRGWVMGGLADAFGARAAWLATAALYALAHVPTVFLLGDRYFGPNPLVLGAALGGGLLWGYIVMRFERLGPAVFAHALFTWGIMSFPLSRL